MCTQKMRDLSYIGAQKITFPPKPDRRTDISVYRVASLLIMIRQANLYSVSLNEGSGRLYAIGLIRG